MPAYLADDEAREWLAREIRRRYPTAEVREQDELARQEGDEPVWYVTKREQHFRIDSVVEVPLERAEAYAVYVDRVAEWQTAVQLTPRPMDPATSPMSYDACYEFLGRRYQGTLRVLAVDPPASASFEATGSGISVWYETTFAPIPGGTRVHVKGDYSLPLEFLTRIADRLGLERAIARDIERANAAFGAICERDARRTAVRSA